MRNRLKKRLLMLGIIGALLVPATAPAREKTTKVDVGVTERQRTKTAQQGPAKTRITRSQAFIIATETRLVTEIRKAIRFLERTLKRVPPKSSSRLKYREKLIDLRLELAVFEASSEMRDYDKAWESWDAGGRRGREPKLDTTKSRKQWTILADDAQKLLAEFPRSKNADTVMFNMGLAYVFLNREKDGARVFSQLIAKYPNSQKAGDAYFSLGDFYFDRNDFRNAMNNYKNALRYRQSKTYSWALFKLGWCAYNLGQYSASLAYWKKTVVASRQAQKSGAQLREEALRDMVYAFAELRQIEPAIAYYRANGGTKYIDRFLLLLSTTFSDQGRYQDAIKVLKRYQQVAPYSEGTPNTQKEIIALYFELNAMPAVWAELSRFPRMYGPNSAWAAKNRDTNKKAFLETQAMIKDQILYYAKITHKNAQKSDNQPLYAEAMKGYRLFLANYPKAPEVAEVKYNMADIEYFSKDYRDAGKLYLEIALMGKDKALIYDPANPKKTTNIHKESSEYMLDAFLKDFEPELKQLIESKNKPDFKGAATPLSARAKNFIKGCAYYVKQYPKDTKNVKQCDIYVTEVYYRSNNKKLATQYLWRMVKKYPGTKEGDEAVRNLIPIFKGNDQLVIATIDKIVAIKPYDSKSNKIGTELAGVKFDLESKACGNEKMPPLKRAETCLALYKKSPNNENAPVFLNNCAVNYLKGNKVDEALSCYGIMLKRFEKSPLSKDALLETAKIYEKKLDFDAASSRFLIYANNYAKEDPKTAVASAAKACELRVAIEANNWEQACDYFARADSGSAKEFVARMMRASYSSRDLSKLAALVRKYTSSTYKPTPAEEIVAWNMIYKASGGSGGAAEQSAQRIMALFRQSGGNIEGEALRAVGGLVFRQVNGAMAQYRKVKLRGGTVDAMAGSIQTKLQALAQVQQAYEQVLGTKDAFWGVAALYQLGYARELFADDLENPPEINGAKPEEVKKQLSGDAKALRQEADQFYKQSLQAVAQFKVYNEWSARALSGLARNGGKSVSFDDIVIEPDFIGSAIPANVAEAVR